MRHLLIEMILQMKPKLQMFTFYKPLNPASITILKTTINSDLDKI